MNVDVLLPYVDNMLKERQDAVEKINAMFDTEISVKLSSSWGLERDNYNALAADLETVNVNPDPTTEPTTEPDPTEETTETDGNGTETDGNDTETDGNGTETEETEETKETETETDGNDTETEETDKNKGKK